MPESTSPTTISAPRSKCAKRSTGSSPPDSRTAEPRAADVELLNKHASQPRLTPRLLPDGTTSREGTAPQLLASLAADLLDLLAGPEIGNVKRCAHPNCSLLYVDSSRAKNRHWCGMATCGNKVKVQAFRARQRASAN